MDNRKTDNYKKKDGDSDSDAENQKLIELKSILRHRDPIHVQECAAENYQLHLGVESIRAPELMFQPSLIGSSEAGIGETIDFVLKQFSNEEQLLLVQNIFLTGGCGNFKGLKERLTRELRQIRPFQSSYCVVAAQNTNLNAWHGARDFARSTDFAKYLTTKNDYEEYGGEYFREHCASNRYFPTPAATVLQTPDNFNAMDEQTNSNSQNKATKMEEEVFVE